MSGGRTAAVDSPEGATKFGGRSSCSASLGLVFALPVASAGGLPVAPGGAAEGGERASAGAGGAAASFLLAEVAGFLSSRIGAAKLGAAVSAAGAGELGAGGTASRAVGVGLLVEPGSAAAAGRGGAALLGAGGGVALGAPSSLGSTSSTLMASGLPSRSPRWRGRERPTPTMALACSRATHDKPIQNLRSDSWRG